MLEIFKAGKHVDSRGIVREFSESQVREIAETYDRSRHEAPILDGHDETKPNKGLIKAVINVGGRVFALPHKVVTEFAESVNSGRIPKLSARLYHPEDPANPVTGKWGLRHVAGVQVPGVKGMESPSFAEGENPEHFVEIEFSESPKFAEADDLAALILWRNLKDLLVTAMPDQATAIQTALPDYLLEMLKPDDDLKPMPYGYSEPRSVSGVEPKSAKETELEERERKLVERERDTEFNEFLRGPELKEKVLPDERDRLLVVMRSLASSQPVQFGEGEATLSPLEAFKNSLTARSKVISFEEKTAPGEVVPEVSFSAPSGFEVSSNRLELHQQVVAKCMALGLDANDPQQYTRALKELS